MEMKRIDKKSVSENPVEGTISGVGAAPVAAVQTTDSLNGSAAATVAAQPAAPAAAALRDVRWLPFRQRRIRR